MTWTRREMMIGTSMTLAQARGGAGGGRGGRGTGDGRSPGRAAAGAGAARRRLRFRAGRCAAAHLEVQAHGGRVTVTRRLAGGPAARRRLRLPAGRGGRAAQLGKGDRVALPARWPSAIGPSGTPFRHRAYLNPCACGCAPFWDWSRWQWSSTGWRCTASTCRFGAGRAGRLAPPVGNSASSGRTRRLLLWRAVPPWQPGHRRHWPPAGRVWIGGANSGCSRASGASARTGHAVYPAGLRRLRPRRWRCATRGAGTAKRPGAASRNLLARPDRPAVHRHRAASTRCTPKPTAPASHYLADAFNGGAGAGQHARAAARPSCRATGAPWSTCSRPSPARCWPCRW